jgi:hypothetical protein
MGVQNYRLELRSDVKHIIDYVHLMKGSRNQLLDRHVSHGGILFGMEDLLEAHTLSDSLQREIPVELMHPTHNIMNVDLALTLMKKHEIIDKAAKELPKTLRPPPVGGK